MESRRNNRHRVFALVASTAVVFSATQAVADEGLPPIDKADRTAVVYTTPDAAVVEAGLSGGPDSPRVSSRGSARRCYLEPDTAPVTSANLAIYADHTDEISYNLMCDGRFSGLVWLPRDPGPRAAPPSPRDVALELREKIPMPAVEVGINPSGRGLVGVETWFWIQGYQGDPITHSTDAFGLPVEVEATPTSYRWDFGDGTVLESRSLGSAYPERSEVRHVYEGSSSGLPAGFPIAVEFSFDVRYRIGGGPWVGLPPITRSAGMSYPVRESQAVITR